MNRGKKKKTSINKIKLGQEGEDRGKQDKTGIRRLKQGIKRLNISN